jgi:hypothetical protein
MKEAGDLTGTTWCGACIWTKVVCSLHGEIKEEVRLGWMASNLQDPMEPLGSNDPGKRDEWLSKLLNCWHSIHCVNMMQACMFLIAGTCLICGKYSSFPLQGVTFVPQSCFHIYMLCIYRSLILNTLGFMLHNLLLVICSHNVAYFSFGHVTYKMMQPVLHGYVRHGERNVSAMLCMYENDDV